jgi:CIC family chloride channel protein
MPVFERARVPFVPVVTRASEESAPELVGALFHVDALRAYNRALAAVSREEHG